jgi:hypothetical protein
MTPFCIRFARASKEVVIIYIGAQGLVGIRHYGYFFKSKALEEKSSTPALVTSAPDFRLGNIFEVI